MYIHCLGPAACAAQIYCFFRPGLKQTMMAAIRVAGCHCGLHCTCRDARICQCKSIERSMSKGCTDFHPALQQYWDGVLTHGTRTGGLGAAQGLMKQWL